MVAHDAGTGFDMFYRAEFTPLIWFARRCGVTQPEAEDLAQEAMKEIWTRWTRVRHPRAYARRIVLRRLVVRRAETRREEEAVRRAGPAGESVCDGLLGPEARRVLMMVRKLPDAQRQVFALAVDGYGPAEIAELTGQLPATVRSHLRHARQRLARMLDSEREESHGP